MYEFLEEDSQKTLVTALGLTLSSLHDVKAAPGYPGYPLVPSETGDSPVWSWAGGGKRGRMLRGAGAFWDESQKHQNC